MKLIEFSEQFPDEKSCREHFKNYRLSEGLICKKCKSAAHYYLRSISKFKCKKCGYRMSLRSGTVMAYSNLPFRVWYIAIALMSCSKKVYSAREVQRQTGHKRYEPIWYLVHKIRVAMGDRDDNYLLKTCVEIDEGFFEIADDIKEVKEQEIVDKSEGKKKGLKRGRGSQKQAKVLVMAESIPVCEVKKNRPAFTCGYFKMKVIGGLDSETINTEVKSQITHEAIVITDGYKGYNHLQKVVSGRIWMEVKPEQAGKLMPWVHIAISNAKRDLLSAFHQIDSKYIQNYLNEFWYKLNRRYFGERLFDRLVIACLSFPWTLGA